MVKKGCTYGRDSKSGKCMSMTRAYSKSFPKKKKGCSYGRNPKSKKCYSKKAFSAKMKRLRKKSAAKKITSLLRKK